MRAASRRTRFLPALGTERGVALAGILVISLLIGAACIGAWFLAHTELRLARRRADRARAERVALGALRIAASWFEAVECGSLVPPPADGELVRDERVIDPDGDGRGPAWDAAEEPWNCRHKARASDAPFRPPDVTCGGSPGDLFVGTPQGPDLRLSDDAASLSSLTAILDPQARVAVVGLRFFGPSPHGNGRAVAGVEARVECEVPGTAPVVAIARGEIQLLDWGRIDRPLLCAGDAWLLGEAGWRWGEAVVGGDLHASAPTRSRWPAGVPWLGPDRVLRADADGDGTDDDADGDGFADVPEWLARPDAVPDPWWRLRVGGDVPGWESGPGPCAQPEPFAPRRDPPEEPDKTAERSGAFLSCPVSPAETSIARGWAALDGSGVRGLRRYVEDDERAGVFRLEGIGDARGLRSILPRKGGGVVLELSDAHGEPLALALDRLAGGILVRGRGVVAQGRSMRRTRAAAPPALRDTRGASRPGWPGDDCLVATPELGLCDGWQVSAWTGPEHCAAGSTAPCPDPEVHLDGVLEVEGELTIEGPARIYGRVVARELVLDGASSAVEVVGRRGAAPRAAAPGLPRVLLAGPRIVRRAGL